MLYYLGSAQAEARKEDRFLFRLFHPWLFYFSFVPDRILKISVSSGRSGKHWGSISILNYISQARSLSIAAFPHHWNAQGLRPPFFGSMMTTSLWGCSLTHDYENLRSTGGRGEELELPTGLEAVTALRDGEGRGGRGESGRVLGGGAEMETFII